MKPPPNPSRIPGSRSVAVRLGLAQTLAWGSSYYLPAILAAPIARDLGIGVSWVFGAFSGALGLTALLGPAVGRLIDRVGGRGLLAASNGVFAIGLVLLAAADGPVGLALAWGVLGVGMAIGLYDAAFAALARLYGLAARRPITGVTLIAGFASTVAWPLTAYLEARHGWRVTCLVWGALHLVAGLPLNVWLPRAENISPEPERVARAAVPPSLASPAPTPSAPPPAARPRVWDRAGVTLAFVFAATWFVTSAMGVHLPALLVASGASPAAAVAAAALLGPAQVGARLLEATLFARTHPVVTARVATAAHPLAAAALLLLGPVAAPAFAVLHGAGNGVLTIAKGTLPLALFGPADYGWRTGLIGAPARLSQALAPLLFGLAVERMGAGALLISSGLSLAALAALMTLTRRTASE